MNWSEFCTKWRCFGRFHWQSDHNGSKSWEFHIEDHSAMDAQDSSLHVYCVKC